MYRIQINNHAPAGTGESLVRAMAKLAMSEGEQVVKCGMTCDVKISE